MAQGIDDNLNPEYYTGRGLQPITVIQKWHLNFALGNVIKYVGRAGFKGTDTAESDLKKAMHYLLLEFEDRGYDLDSFFHLAQVAFNRVEYRAQKSTETWSDYLKDLSVTKIKLYPHENGLTCWGSREGGSWGILTIANMDNLGTLCGAVEEWVTEVAG